MLFEVHTIGWKDQRFVRPCLELCSIILAAEIAKLVLEEKAIKPDSIIYYSDSKVVLGYIANETWRFYA